MQKHPILLEKIIVQNVKLIMININIKKRKCVKVSKDK